MRKLTHIKSVCFLIIALVCSLNLTAQTEEGTIKVQSNQNIKKLIAKKKAYNKNQLYTKGYKIQLFYGSEQGAISLKEKFNSVFPDIPSELKFKSPDWKVWVGSYKTKLEAARALVEIKEGFPGAIRVNAKVRN